MELIISPTYEAAILKRKRAEIASCPGFASGWVTSMGTYRNSADIGEVMLILNFITYWTKNIPLNIHWRK